MKQLLIVLVLSLAVLTADAKVTVYTSATEVHIGSKNKPRDLLKGVTIDEYGDILMFNGLHGTASLDMYVMANNGNLELTATISREHNTINMSQFSRANHIIALKQGDNVKMFVAGSPVTIHAMK